MSIVRLSSLRVLRLSGCTDMTGLPKTFRGLPSLETLDLRGCTGMAALPAGIFLIPTLRTLRLEGFGDPFVDPGLFAVLAIDLPDLDIVW